MAAFRSLVSESVVEAEKGDIVAASLTVLELLMDKVFAVIVAALDVLSETVPTDLVRLREPLAEMVAIGVRDRDIVGWLVDKVTDATVDNDGDEEPDDDRLMDSLSCDIDR